jgi:peptidoglycan/LPS O-acetylase OafA/YrhL
LVGLSDRGALRRALEWPTLRGLGKYSYAMYVFHWPIHIALAPLASGLVNAGSPFRRLLTFVLYAAVVGMLSLASAVISWKVLESPFLRLKDRLAPRPAAQARPDQPT